MKKKFLISFAIVVITLIGSCGSYWLCSKHILEQVTKATTIVFPSLVGLATGLLIRGRHMWLYCSLGVAVGVANYVGIGLIDGSFPSGWLAFSILFVGQPLMFLLSAMLGDWIGRRYFHARANSALSSRTAAAPSRVEAARSEDRARDIVLTEPQPSPQPKTPRIPLFTFTAVLGFVACLFMPPIIVPLPILGTIAFAIIALFRRERARVVSRVVLVATIALLILNSNPLRAVEITSWNWKPNPGFPQYDIKGTITWNAQVRNISHSYVKLARLELTTYDESGNAVRTELRFVFDIPPGETRSLQTFTVYDGTEKRAAVQVMNVDLSVRVPPDRKTPPL